MRKGLVVSIGLTIAIASVVVAGEKDTRTARLGVNLLENPGAEEPHQPNQIPAWQTAHANPADDGVSVAEYGSIPDEWGRGLEGTPHGGKNYFRLAFEDHEEHFMSQKVDVSALAAVIARGDVTATVSGAVGAFVDSDTTAILGATFLDAKGNDLGTIATKRFDSEKLQRGPVGDTALMEVSTEGLVPVGTRSIIYTLVAGPNGGSYHYRAMADNLSLVLSEPKPNQ